MSDGWIFVCICVAPAALMLLGQFVIRTYYRILMIREERAMRRFFAMRDREYHW